ncbi:MAG TPA: hypothetical protein VFV98_07220 [Vicinamibacterales bacterium]|nr:hypothetical protein [Vicinamibacterales bacterium]
MIRIQPRAGFDLDHYLLFDQKIQTEAAFDADAPSLERLQDLTLHAEAAPQEFGRQKLLARGFPETRPPRFMYGQGGVDDLAGDVVDPPGHIQRTASSVPVETGEESAKSPASLHLLQRLGLLGVEVSAI